MFLGCFGAHARQPHNHIGWATSMPYSSINPTNPRTNPWNFHEKILRIGGAGKWDFFEAAILNFLSRPFWIFFCFISVKNPALLYEVSFFSALWMVFPESWKRSCPNFYAHDCNLILNLWFTASKIGPKRFLFLLLWEHLVDKILMACPASTGYLSCLDLSHFI